VCGSVCVFGCAGVCVSGGRGYISLYIETSFKFERVFQALLTAAAATTTNISSALLLDPVPKKHKGVQENLGN